MKRIVIIPNVNKDEGMAVTGRLVSLLLSHGARLYIDNRYFNENISGVNYYSEFPSDAEAIVVVGGDGSMLDASVFAIEKDIPIVGVNLGRVGYLSEIEPSDIEILSGLVTDKYAVKEEMLLSVEYSGAKESIRAERLAVNDVAVSHDSFFGISKFSLYTKNGECMKYRADGLLFATRLGSTAYSLSAGGPILGPDVRAILVTPICSHSFFNRSVLFSEGEVMAVMNTGESHLNVSIDGRFFCRIEPGERISVSRAEKKLKILTFNTNNTFATLFGKIKIMEDVK